MTSWIESPVKTGRNVKHSSLIILGSELISDDAPITSQFHLGEQERLGRPSAKAEAAEGVHPASGIKFPANIELPVSILGYNDSVQQRELLNAAARGITLRDSSRSGKLQRFRSTATSLQFESLNKAYHLTELARGDFNADGFEDSLVAVSWHYREGMGLGCSMLLVQRAEGKTLTGQPFLLRRPVPPWICPSSGGMMP